MHGLALFALSQEKRKHKKAPIEWGFLDPYFLGLAVNGESLTNI